MDRKAFGLIIAAMTTVLCGSAFGGIAASVPTTEVAGTPNATQRV